MYQKEKKYWLKHLDFIIVDLILFELAYFLAVFVRNRGNTGVSEVNYRMSAIIVIIFILVALLAEGYHGILRRGYYREFVQVMKQVLLNMISISTYLYITKSGESHSRLVWVMMGLFGFIFIYLVHIIMKKLIQKYKEKSTSKEKMVVFTTKECVQKDLKRLLSCSSYEDYEVAGVVVIDEDLRGKKIEDVPVVGYRGDALNYVQKNVVDEVFLHFAGEIYLQENLMQYFRRMGIAVHIYVSEYMPETSKYKTVQNVGGFTVISNSIVIASPIQLFLKRCMDIAGGIVGTILTGIIFLIFAPIIYIQSPGPIFFTQIRIGKNGRRFKIYKFRSMYMDAEERKKELMAQNKMNGLMFKMDNDPRIIPIGRFMRATSLDEFPQFINVLKGNMSLVGTRPPTEDEYIQYKDYHKRRLAVKPGITGMWQVSGRSNITDFEEVVALDSKYIEDWNIGKDIKILFKTIAVVFARKGSV